MTTLRNSLRSELVRQQVVGKMLWAVLLGLVVCTSVSAQNRPVHRLNAGALPPGAIGRQRHFRDASLSGFCQPVSIRAPQGARIAPAAGSGFLSGRKAELLVGLAIGPVYRFRVTEIPEHPGLEVFPTVEVVDRLCPPEGQKLKFPIPIELTQDELLAAAEGRFITRVIYLEDPELAPAIPRDQQQQPWTEARPGEDPLQIADYLGRPMAILRMGGRLPDDAQPDEAFLYGAPPAQVYEPPVDETAFQTIEISDR